MKKTMYGYRGLDAAYNLYFVMPTDLGYEFSISLYKQKEQRGEIVFNKNSSSCVVKLNGDKYIGLYSLDNKVLKIEIPGLTNHAAILKEFKFKRR